MPLHLFNDLPDAILTEKTLESKSQEDEDNENENENENVNENEDDDKTMSQNKIIKKTNDVLDEIIDKSKSFEEQIKLLEKWEDLNRFWPYNNHGDRESKFKDFEIKIAEMLKIIDKKLFETIFGHTLEALANKLINTAFKKENQIIVENIDKNKDKLYEECEIVIMWSNQMIVLLI